MATKILNRYKQQISVLQLEPSGGGCFELQANGEMVYSKLATGQFPDEDEMVAEIGRRL